MSEVKPVSFVKLYTDDKTGMIVGFFVLKDSMRPIVPSGSGSIIMKVNEEKVKAKGHEIIKGAARRAVVESLPAKERAEVESWLGDGKDIVAKAKDLGKAAYHAGKKRKFVLDREAQKLLFDLKPGEGSEKIMKAWYAGWDAENINAPVPEPAGPKPVEQPTGLDITQIETKAVVSKVIEIVKAVAGRYGLATKIKNDNTIPAIVVGGGFVVTKIDRSAGKWNINVVHGGMPVVSIMAKSHPALLADLEPSLDEQVGMIVNKLAKAKPAVDKPAEPAGHEYEFTYAVLLGVESFEQYHQKFVAESKIKALKEFEKFWYGTYPSGKGFYWLHAKDGNAIPLQDLEIHDVYFDPSQDIKGKDAIIKAAKKIHKLIESIEPPSAERNMLIRVEQLLEYMYKGDPKERVVIHRQLNMLGVKYDQDLPLDDLKDLLKRSQKQKTEPAAPKPAKEPTKPETKKVDKPEGPPKDLGERITLLVKKLSKKDKFVPYISKLHKKQKELAAATGAAKETAKADLTSMVRKYEKLVEPKKRAAPGEPKAVKKQKGEVKPKPTGGQRKKKRAGESAYQKEYKYAKEGLVKMVGEDVAGSRREDWHKYFGRTMEELEKEGVAGQVIVKKFLWPRPELDEQRKLGKSAGHIYLHYKLWFSMNPKPTFDDPLNRAVYREICEYSVKEINKAKDLKEIRDAVAQILTFIDNKLKPIVQIRGRDFIDHTIGKRFEKALKEFKVSYSETRMAAIGISYYREKDRMRDAKIIEGSDGFSDEAYERLRKQIYEREGRKESETTKVIDLAKFIHKNRFKKYREHRWKFGLNIPKKLQDTFALRAVQLGQWTVGKEKVTENITMPLASGMYGALWDIADVVGMSDKKQISFGGRLAVSLAARGQGKGLAHYEFKPGTIIINVTREYGNGCVAHEWAHALDHHVGKSLFNALGINKVADNLFGTDRLESPHYLQSIDLGATDRYGPLARYPHVVEAWNYLVNTFDRSGFVDRMKRETGLSAGYYASLKEVLARTFEAYVYDKLPDMKVHAIDYAKIKELVDEKGEDNITKKDLAKLPTKIVEVKNPYLVRDNLRGGGYGMDATDISVYPQGQERRMINEAFSLFFKAMAGKWDDVFPSKTNQKPKKHHGSKKANKKEGDDKRKLVTVTTAAERELLDKIERLFKKDPYAFEEIKGTYMHTPPARRLKYLQGVYDEYRRIPNGNNKVSKR